MKALSSKTPALEWIAATVGLLFLTFLLIAIGHDAVTGDSAEQPSIRLKVRQVSPATGGYVVAFEAVNDRGSTIAALGIEGELRQGEAVIETSLATIDYLPGHGRVEGGLFFSKDPKSLTLRLRPTGYQTP